MFHQTCALKFETESSEVMRQREFLSVSGHKVFIFFVDAIMATTSKSSLWLGDNFKFY